MHALRIARAHTNREKFIKFEGTYHGMYDYALFSTTIGQARSMGSRRSPIRIPSSSGIPYGIGEYVFTLPYNDLEMLRRTVKGRWGEIAAIMVEPLMGNNASVMPEPGFLELMRELCSEYGIVLIVDEVKTGFRIANGGAQQYFHIKADLATYAKSIANGFPLAAIAGTDEIMSVIQPGRVAVGGTYCGNIPGTAAADATLELLETQPMLDTIARRGKRLMDGIDKILTEANIPHALMGPPQMFGFVLGSRSRADQLSRCTGYQHEDVRAHHAGDDPARRDAGTGQSRAVVPVLRSHRRSDRRNAEHLLRLGESRHSQRRSDSVGCWAELWSNQ